MNTLSVFAGAYRHEFAMQIRRRSLWITIIIFEVVLLLLVSRNFNIQEQLKLWPTISSNELTGNWTGLVMLFTPIAIGCLLADRFPRDRKQKVEELLDTTPGSLSGRIWGKYLGTTLATMIPMLIFYSLGVIVILFIKQDILVLPLALAYFAATILPGLLFISAFSIACPAFIWVPLYQFLFVGYWFWGNILNVENFPSLSRTELAPIGNEARMGIFNLGSTSGELGHITVVQGCESIGLLTAIAILIIVAFTGILRVQRRKR